MFCSTSLSPTITLPTTITATSNPRTVKPGKPFNLTLRSLCRSGRLEEAVRLIESAPSKFVDPQSYSLVLHSCISCKSLELGQRLYLQLLLRRDRGNDNLLDDQTVRAKLVTLYSVCGQVDQARQIFEDGLDNGLVSESMWVAMAVGYSKNGCSKEALLLYRDMLLQCVVPSKFALSMALKASADLTDLWVGKAVHAQVVKSGEDPDQAVYNALLNLYGECGSLEEALRVFEKMPEKNVISWNSLIAAFVEQNQVTEALSILRRMQRGGILFSWVTLTTILGACAAATALHSGKEVHAQIVKSKARPDILVLNSLMDMYAKCGITDYCKKVFDQMQAKDLTTWNTLLNSYAVNGSMDETVKLFDAMTKSGIRPDAVTFVTLLSGCSHTGLTDEGRKLFDQMEDFKISLTSEHYACLVDMLGRAGKIEEALKVAENMPMKPSGSVWGSILNSCRLHGNVAIAEKIAGHLFELEPNNSGNYVILSNIYANAGMWDHVEVVRKLMEERGIKKEAGCSWIQIKNRIHTFVAGGHVDFQNSSEYRNLWSDLMEAMEEVGYVPDTRAVLHNVNEDMKTLWVCGHSERLATTFALIHTGAGTPIRITKNLRVCVDCHSWMKFVSRVTSRVITLRDTNRFHHFKGGTCSCKDYW
ncbi:pentatricopeptide repeat-containing protein At3g14330 [Eucalyptus grandis]|uniref:pentatricopeptide repeat-containing protein At3g14330 n=1 Tax=Eucalyptus grandis TaxID=71139 RepID=UPI00192EFC4D|nr:pentatricopeptide repeat-containing protein At3g14330 [Eucalyptus grandis]